MIVYDKMSQALMKVSEGYDPDTEATRAGFSDYLVMTKDEWHNSSFKAELRVARRRVRLRTLIEEEASRRIIQVSPGVKGYEEGLAVAALMLPTSLNLDGLKVRDIALYARQKVSQMKTATDDQIMRYDPAKDPNWP